MLSMDVKAWMLQSHMDVAETVAHDAWMLQSHTDVARVVEHMDVAMLVEFRCAYLHSKVDCRLYIVFIRHDMGGEEALTWIANALKDLF